MSRLQQLEFSGNAPLPEELAAYLGGRIAQGIYRPGDKLPPERELAARFEVSRKTVRLALEEIERQGFIYRRVGKGTFVKRGAGARRDGGAGRSSNALISFKYTNPYSDGHN